MCCDVRCTERRKALSSRIFARLLTARLNRWAFLFITTRTQFIRLETGAGPCFFHRPPSAAHRPRSLLLRFLQLDLLTRIAHALALVRLGRTERTDVGSHLSHALHIGAFHDDFRLRRRFDRDAFRRDVDDRVRKPERQVQVLALCLGAITDADELELALIALADALDDVRKMRARRARNHVGVALSRHLLDREDVSILHDTNVPAVERQAHRALATLHGDGLGGNRRAHALRQRYRLFCYSRHFDVPKGFRSEPKATVAYAS